MGWSFGSRDMPKIEVGVRSVWLAKERARLIDGCKRRATMGIQSFIWTVAYMGREAEDRASPILVGKFSKDRWLVTHPVPCKGTQHRWIVGKLVNDVIMGGVQTLPVPCKGTQHRWIVGKLVNDVIMGAACRPW